MLFCKSSISSAKYGSFHELLLVIQGFKPCIFSPRQTLSGSLDLVQAVFGSIDIKEVGRSVLVDEEVVGSFLLAFG